MGGEGVRQILGVDIRMSFGAEGDYSRFKLLRGIEKRKLVLCKYTSKVSHVFVRVSPFPISPPSLTCKWQKDSAATPGTCPVCCSVCLDNCYGNCMSQGSVDWLIQAVSQTDESFEPACLFRPALVMTVWQRVRLSSPVIMERIKCEEKRWCRGGMIELKNQGHTISKRWRNKSIIGMKWMRCIDK